jgi:hypothetical protein
MKQKIQKTELREQKTGVRIQELGDRIEKNLDVRLCVHSYLFHQAGDHYLILSPVSCLLSLARPIRPEFRHRIK